MIIAAGRTQPLVPEGERRPGRYLIPLTCRGIMRANLPSLTKLISVGTSLPLDKAVNEAMVSGRKYMGAGSAGLAVCPKPSR